MIDLANQMAKEHNIVTVCFNKKSKVQFLEDNGKPSWYFSDVMPGEHVFFFEYIVKASERTVFLKCLDGQVAFVKLDDVSNISIS